MFSLFIGDVYETLANQAKSFDSDAVFISKDNIEEFICSPAGVAYTSLADVNDHELFFQLCNLANAIYYRPPSKWSSAEHKYYTEHTLAYVSQYRTIDGFDHLLEKNKKFNVDFLQDTRKTEQSQLWAVGCSITFGVGVGINEKYSKILSNKLDLEESNLSCPGSSIIWQSDQICRSDIRANDIVVWGLTANNRIPVMYDDKVFHLNTLRYTQHPELKTKFPIDILDNDTLCYHNILAVRRAFNFCQKAKAKLVILGLILDWDSLYLCYQVPVFRCITPIHRKYIDLGWDQQHPGPEQHKIFAKEFLTFYKQLYQLPAQ
jgi:hypothetical protein